MLLAIGTTSSAHGHARVASRATTPPTGHEPRTRASAPAPTPTTAEDERSWNARDLDEYLAAIEDGHRPIAGVDRLDEGTRAFEAMALGLRRIDGVERDAFAAEFGADPLERFAGPLAEADTDRLIEISADRLRLTPAGRLMASEACLCFLPA